MTLRHLAPVALALVLSPAFAQTDDVRATITSIQRLLATRPNEPTLYYYLAAFQARAGDNANAVASLERLASIGTGFLPTPLMGFNAIWQDDAFKRVYAELEAKIPRVADAPVAFELADRNLIPEGIAWDPVSERFFLGSIAQRRIISVDATGRFSPYSGPDDGLQHILGLAVDARRRTLHAVSTSALTATGRETRVNEIVSYDLRNDRKISAVSIPGAEQLNDVTFAPNGDLYASDSSSGAVWRIRAGVATEFLPAGRTPGSNGLAVSADGAILYVAHSTGVARIDTTTVEVERMEIPSGETVAAIDGLYLYEDSLLGVQNVTNPARIIRMYLSGDGKSVTRVVTLQSHHNPAFDEPTTGAVVGNAFYVLATTQVARFSDNGELLRPEGAMTPKVIRIPLSSPSAARVAD